MENGSKKQRAKLVEEIWLLAVKSGFDHTAIAVEARISYPRYRRIFFENAEPKPGELDKIRGAILRMVEREQKRLSELRVS